MEVSWWTAGIAYISHCSSPQEALNRARIAQAAWKGVHQVVKGNGQGQEEEDTDVDVWDIKHGTGSGTGVNDKTIRHALPDYDAVQGEASTPPCLVIEVSELPRGVGIEWWSIGLSNSLIRATPYNREIPLRWTYVEGTETSFVTAELEHGSIPAFGFLNVFMETAEVAEWDHVTVYASPSLSEIVLMDFPKCTQVVPCISVWGEGGKSLAGAVVGRRTNRG
jgi:diphthine-ammonia ligase